MTFPVRAILWVAIAFLSCGAIAQPGTTAIERRNEATVAVLPPGAGPAPHTSFGETTLPDRWAGPGETAPEPHWYRFEVDGRALHGARGAVFLPDVAMNAEVFWNGTSLGDGGRFEPPIAQNFHRPLYFRVPQALVREGANRLDVRVETAPCFYGWLGEVEIGPDAVLAPRFDAEWRWRVALPQGTTILGVVVALLLASFWFSTRDSLYAWMTAATLCWTVGNLNLHVRELPVSTMAWARTIQLAIAWTPVAFTLYAHRLIGADRPGAEKALAVYAAGLFALAVGVPDHAFLPSFTALHIAGLGLGLYGLAVIILGIRRLTRTEISIFAGSFAVLLAIAFHDTAIQFGEREGTPRYWNALAAPVFLSAFAATLTLRFARTLQRAEHHNEELEERVQAKHAELESQFARVRRMEDERILADERGRMMREMHDGLGSRLVEMLSMIEAGDAEPDELAGSVRASLDEMRLLIDSLDPAVEDLEDLLGLIRDRLDPSLRRQGIELDWELASLPEDWALGPQEGLHLLRIVQEALTNVSKHAEAHRVEFRVETAQMRDGGPGLRIRIRDDGRGLALDPTGRSEGRGLGNMRRRAEALGGRVEITGSQRGTEVDLWIPSRAPRP
ncbi:MAG: sensor histidine kinase [Myxococcota bacterium]